MAQQRPAPWGSDADTGNVQPPQHGRRSAGGNARPSPFATDSDAGSPHSSIPRRASGAAAPTMRSNLPPAASSTYMAAAHMQHSQGPPGFESNGLTYPQKRTQRSGLPWGSEDDTVADRERRAVPAQQVSRGGGGLPWGSEADGRSAAQPMASRGQGAAKPRESPFHTDAGADTDRWGAAPQASRGNQGAAIPREMPQQQKRTGLPWGSDQDTAADTSRRPP
eukprot:CAMPEP_0180175188 /NCGR_PEP_ID=MMETSP0986-20121125/36582_1 /TAXON_ID=697907 /ORGANISM="non described non described, Strain CCMP2293" /LENGTH=221 /DNA_ID=CAMNT_0022127639 /DNA_START=68 /DNA_END=729 /DNA_ORIENTATION=+